MLDYMGLFLVLRRQIRNVAWQNWMVMTRKIEGYVCLIMVKMSTFLKTNIFLNQKIKKRKRKAIWMYVRQLRAILKPFTSGRDGYSSKLHMQPIWHFSLFTSKNQNPFGFSSDFAFGIFLWRHRHRFFRNIYTHLLNSEDRNRAKEDNKNFKKQIRLRIILCYFFHKKSGFDRFSDWSIQFLIYTRVWPPKIDYLEITVQFVREFSHKKIVKKFSF